MLLFLDWLEQGGTRERHLPGHPHHPVGLGDLEGQVLLRCPYGPVDWITSQPVSTPKNPASLLRPDNQSSLPWLKPLLQLYLPGSHGRREPQEDLVGQGPPKRPR